LKVLGIDLGTQVKTEKSIAEQELEINLSFTLSKILEDGKTLIPLFGAHKTGMQNLGNTCYMNSVMQVMLHQQDFRDKYEKGAVEHLSTCKKHTPDCFQCQMRKLAHGLASAKYSTKKLADKVITEQMSEEDKQKVRGTDEFHQDGVRPQLFQILVGKGHVDFQTAQQQDAREYLQYVLDKIKKEEMKTKSSDPGLIFQFTMEKRL